MSSITYIGMDVHTTNNTLCVFTLQTQPPFFELQIHPEFRELKKHLTNMDQIQGSDSRFVCGYEAGCLRYSLYKEITAYKWKDFSVECVIMAPSTMAFSPKDKVLKTDGKSGGTPLVLWPLRKFCVSDIRQNQEYHVVPVQNEAYFT